MLKASELLKTNHSKQLTWLKNQFLKGEMIVFLNPQKARDAYNKIDENLIINDEDLEAFIARYLSEIGKKKLITTLRVALTRAKKEERLQVNLSGRSGSKLDYIKKNTGLTKEQIINIMIQKADLSIFKGAKEDQLE